MTARVAGSHEAVLENGKALPLASVPALDGADFHDAVVAECRAGARISAWLALAGGSEILAALALDDRGKIMLLRCALGDLHWYPAVTSELPQAQAFERALYEAHGIFPEGHPWLKPLRRHADLEPSATGPRIPSHEFFKMEGAPIHEVAVGPVHAGVIEPGHFRFQCQGEWVKHLEIQLGYQHRGAERLLLEASPARRLVVAESIAGDTVIGHGWAHAAVLEALAGVEPPPEAKTLRAIALELERLANHAGDLGALCNDVGYLPGSSWLGRLRGEFLNLLLELSGNRFGRGLVVPGGVHFGVPRDERASVSARIERAATELERVAALALDSPSVMGRFEGTGRLAERDARALGIVGVAARASGVQRDVRRDHPRAGDPNAAPPALDTLRGDVLARALVRREESLWSARFVRDTLAGAPEAACARPMSALRPAAVAVTLVEGWRGEVCHVCVTDQAGNLAGYAIVDPSLHNWFGLAIAMRDNLISDFPLCNKSFNLSYAGHDL